MYLTIRQHDLFRTVLMGFEIPFRAYIAKTVTTAYGTDSAFESAMLFKNTLITPSSPQFLKNVLPKECRKGTLKTAYTKFVTATTSTDEIVTTDIDLPMVGALNLVTFALTENFTDLYRVYLGFTPSKIHALTQNCSSFLDNLVLLFILIFVYTLVFIPTH